MSSAPQMRTIGKAIPQFPSTRVFAEVSYFKNQMAAMEGFESVADTLARDQADAWEKRILEILNSYTLPGRWTTLCVLTEIERASKRNGTCVVITPMNPRAPSSGDKPVDIIKRYFNAHTYGRDTGGRVSDAEKGIAGVGDVAIIQFDPFTWDDGSALLDIARTMLPDDYEPCGMQTEDVLFHELIHALRYIQGLVNDHADESKWGGYENREEFLAVVITNIAISERDPGAKLRRNHGMFTRIPDKLATSEGFLTHADNPKRLRELYPYEVSLFHNIAGSPYKESFNPIRAFLGVK